MRTRPSRCPSAIGLRHFIDNTTGWPIACFHRPRTNGLNRAVRCSHLGHENGWEHAATKCIVVELTGAKVDDGAPMTNEYCAQLCLNNKLAVAGTENGNE